MERVPCPCQVGDGRRLSFKDLRNIFLNLSQECGDPVLVKSLAVSGCCCGGKHLPGISWLVDFECVDGPSAVDDHLDNAVQKLMMIVQGKILGYGADFIRAAVPVTRQ